MRFIGIIPARFASVRFPGKPLVDVFGKPMIQRVYENSSSVLDFVAVATDDQRIFDAVSHFGGDVVMTSATHRSGTDRCAEAARLIREKMYSGFDVVINIQGDEPFIEPRQLQLIMSCFIHENTSIATLVRKIGSEEELSNPNLPKVVLNKENGAVYFSRSPIPYLRNVPSGQWTGNYTFYGHIGLYAYRCDVLDEITRLQPSTLEMAESLEQLRWIENGYRIRTAVSTDRNYAVDTPDDLKKILLMPELIAKYGS